MKRLSVAIRRTALAAAAACVAATGLAAPSSPAVDSRAPTSPDQPHPRAGGYRILGIGSATIRARCDEGGFVFVARHPTPGHESKPEQGAQPPHGITRERDAAIRTACRDVDYSK